VTAALGVLAVWAGVAAWLAVDFSGRIQDWAIQNDETLYTKLAISVADTGSPVPHVHDQVVAVLNQLYPLLIAPFFAAFDFPTAFHAAHVFNAPLMASACIPAYLIARLVVSRPAALAVALLSVTIPWMVLTGVLMTEPAAYPAFLWAVLACLWAIREPSRRHDLFAVLGLVLGVLARTQFVVLAVVLPVSILVDVLAASPAGPVGRRLVDAAVSSVRRHEVLTIAYLAAGGIAIGIAVVGSLGDALGVYGTTLHGSILPAGVWREAATHLDAVAVGCGLVPFLLGGGWMLAAVARPRERDDFSFAVFGVLTIAALAVETASFDLRFGGEIVRDRYLFYVVPLLLAGTAAALRARAMRPVVIGTAATTVFFAATVHWLDFPTTIAFWVDSPERILNGTLADQSGSLSTAAFVALAGGLLGLVLIAAFVVVPRRVLGVLLLVFLLPFTVLTTRKEVDSVAAANSTSGRPFARPPGRVLNWVDSVLPREARAAQIPFPNSPEFPLDALLWWDVEFWNGTVGETLVAPDHEFSYAPFPNRTLHPDWKTGTVPGTATAPQFVVFSPSDARFRLSGPTHAENLGLRVILADRPYRLDWMTRGLDIDGWQHPGRRATLRVYSPAARAELVDMNITLDSPPQAPADYAVVAGETRRAGRLAAGTAQTVSLPMCVPARSFADVTLSSKSAVRIAAVPLSFAAGGTRPVGARVGPIEPDFTHRPC
jgi:hypothetical protein